MFYKKFTCLNVLIKKSIKYFKYLIFLLLFGTKKLILSYYILGEDNV